MRNLLLTFALLLAVSFAPGCSTPQRGIYTAESATVLTVDTAMTTWGNYVAQFHPPVERELLVKAAYEKYQACMALAVDAARAWSSLGTNGPPTMDPAFSQRAADALADLLTLLRQFGAIK